MAVLAGLDTTVLAKADNTSLSLEGFRDLLSAMTGFTPRDVSLIEAFREAFADELAGLKQLSDIVVNSPESEWSARIKQAKLEPLAESLVATAYTGITGEGAEARVITYLNAFVWHVCGYTKPPSQCDWNFGAWAYPPPRGRFDE
jgi:uncharacterized protein with von Willebrand factor type A (vWA) domain